MSKGMWWVVGLIALVVVAYGGYRVIKHFMRLAVATPTPVATIAPATTPTLNGTPTASPVPTKTPVATVAPTQVPNIYGY